MLIEQLESLTDDLAALEAWTLTGSEVREVAIALQKARTTMDAALTRVAGAADDMGLATDDGATSTTAWLANLTGIHKGEAAKLVGLARVTTEFTGAAWMRGDVTTEQAGVIMKAIHALPEWVGDEERADAEQHLIELASDHNLDDLKRLANHVMEVIDPDGADEVLGKKLQAEEARAWDATRLTMRRCGDGTTDGRFKLPDADADVLQAAVEGIIAPRRSSINETRHGVDDFNTLPRAQRMGLAFTELLNHLPTESLPKAGGLAATVAVTIDIDDLRTGQGVATNTSNTTISATKAQRLACNAHLVALYLDSESRVLDHGMTKRLFDRHQRLALAVRDQGCVWPGCDRPPAWCEAHHLNAWSEGGPTDLHQGALFCHFHHFKLHEGEWLALMADDGVVEVIPPRRIDPDQVPRRHARFTKQQPRAA
ncbi:HNH endonuclease signature motif containing protein [Aeromicrobium panaciterrae]|uniref:HNH endonuclease signature motif containing protein n=1 Tax=Aeromicrobium panaciterrae TaxID=363861 RepID=UPI0031D579E5